MSAKSRRMRRDARANLMALLVLIDMIFVIVGDWSGVTWVSVALIAVWVW